MKKFRVIWQYILFYLIISAIPIATILFYFYPLAKRIVINKARESNINVTRNITNTMNTQLSGIYNIGREIRTDSRLTPYAVTKNPYAEIEAVGELKKILSSNAVVFDVLYYMGENNTFYTKNTLVRVDTYDDRYTVYKYQERDMQKFLKEMSELESFEVLPAEPVAASGASIRDMITFVFPIQGNAAGTNQAVALVLVEESALTRLVDIYSGKYEDNVLVFDLNGQLITSSNKNLEFSEKELEELLEWEGQEASRIVEAGEKEFILSKVKSRTNGWSYISYINMEELTGELSALQSQTVLIVMLLMLFELLLIIFFARVNYRPIKKLLVVLKGLVSQEEFESMAPGNEFQKMEYLFGSLDRINDELHDKIRQAYPALRNELLRKLLNGEMVSCGVEAVDEMGAEVGVSFGHGSYSVAVIAFEAKEHAVDLKAVKEFLDAPEGKTELKIYAVSDMRRNSVVLLTNQEGEEELLRYLSRAREELMDRFRVRVWIGVSNCSSDIRDYSFLYVQALSAIEFLQLEKETGIIRMEDLWLESWAFKDYPLDLVSQLESAVNRQEGNAVRRLAKELAEILSDLSRPVYFIRILYRNVISCMLRGIFMISKEDKRENVQWNRYLFDGSYSPETLVYNVLNCCEELCRGISKSGDEREEPFDEVLAWIDENCLKYNFSIHSASARFGAKISNFSQYFKKKSGVTFKQYVDCRKAEKAKELLADTDESLENISEILSYSNASSFIRAFKRVSNMTPGEYREKVRSCK